MEGTLQGQHRTTWKDTISTSSPIPWNPSNITRGPRYWWRRRKSILTNLMIQIDGQDEIASTDFGKFGEAIDNSTNNILNAVHEYGKIFCLGLQHICWEDSGRIVKDTAEKTVRKRFSDSVAQTRCWDTVFFVFKVLDRLEVFVLDEIFWIVFLW